MNVAGLFDAPRGPAAKRLRELAGRLNELKAEGRELRAKEAEDGRVRADLTARLHGAQARDHAFGDAAAGVKAAKGELGKLEKSTAARADKVRVVTDAGAIAEGELRRYAAEHSEALWAEMGGDNRKAAERLVKPSAPFTRRTRPTPRPATAPPSCCAWSTRMRCGTSACPICPRTWAGSPSARPGTRARCACRSPDCRATATRP
jgi:hypothetical protein